MTTSSPLEKRCQRATADAAEALASAQAARKVLRRTTSPGQDSREKKIEGLLREINYAMEPVRSLIGKALREPLPGNAEDEIRELSQALQYERRQLKKMRRP